MRFAFEADVKAQEEGKWFRPKELMDKGRIKVRASTCSAYRKEQQRLLIEAQKLPMDERTEFLEKGQSEALRDIILVDFELIDITGAVHTYTPALAIDLMNHKNTQYRFFQNAVASAADENAKTTIDLEDEEVKLSAGLSGNPASSDPSTETEEN